MIIKAIIGIVAFLVLAPFVGGLLAGLDRKLSAKMQRRVGPPVLQPFYDVGKLFQKEKQTPTRFQDFYVLLFVVFVIASGVLFFSGGDLLLVIFTLTIGAAFLIIAAYSSNSPYAELYTGSFRVSDILAGDTMPFLPLLGIFFGWLFILTLKFRKSPFDLSMSHHAHQELGIGTARILGVELYVVHQALCMLDGVCRALDYLVLAHAQLVLHMDGRHANARDDARALGRLQSLSCRINVGIDGTRECCHDSLVARN